MKKKIDPVVDEAIETLNMKDGPSRRRLLEGAGLFSATAAASALLAACTSSSSSSATPTAAASAAKAVVGNFPTTPAWQFWFVNHVTTNLFFVPTQNGMKDAAKLLGLPAPKWGGSTTSTASQMVSYLDSAIAASGQRHRHHRDRRHLVHHARRERDERRHPRDQLQRGRSRQQGRG